MKLDVNTPMTSIEGEPLKIEGTGKNSKDSAILTLGDVLINVALTPAGPNKTYTQKQHVIRYELALGCQKAKKLDPSVIEVSAEVATEIKEDLSRLYAPLIAGQVLPMLDGK